MTPYTSTKPGEVLPSSSIGSFFFFDSRHNHHRQECHYHPSSSIHLQCSIGFPSQKRNHPLCCHQLYNLLLLLLLSIQRLQQDHFCYSYFEQPYQYHSSHPHQHGHRNQRQHHHRRRRRADADATFSSRSAWCWSYDINFRNKGGLIAVPAAAAVAVAILPSIRWETPAPRSFECSVSWRKIIMIITIIN